MEYVGIEVNTNCNMTCFPAPERKQVVQDYDLCLILSTIPVKTSRLLRPKVSGNPKYFPIPPSLSMPSFYLTLALILSGVLEEKVIDDFIKLMLWPELSSYLLRIELKALQFLSFVLQKIIVSSAKSR